MNHAQISPSWRYSHIIILSLSHIAMDYSYGHDTAQFLHKIYCYNVYKPLTFVPARNMLTLVMSVTNHVTCLKDLLLLRNAYSSVSTTIITILNLWHSLYRIYALSSQNLGRITITSYIRYNQE